ncbi:MAG: M23 family metallopeptidase, partial [Flavobacteriales bacterium]|nr:M23 family metallopeptidase [Flavobacteriales bacterium]
PDICAMAARGDGTKRQRVLHKLRNKYRLQLLDEGSFEPRFSMRLSRMNVILLLIAAFTVHGLLVLTLIVFTPLKEYIPGYSDQQLKMHAYRSTQKADSLTTVVAVQDRYITNLRAILRGDLPEDSATGLRAIEQKPSAADLVPSASDSAFRARLAEEEAYTLSGSDPVALERREIAGVFFFPPLRGVITGRFERTTGHYGVDIVTKADEAVKATLAGTVTLASWTTDGGHVIQLQHANGLVSVYKHNSVLLKGLGDRVQAGEAIAIVGNSGELTTGPHLHFELWFNGEPVDPESYMVIK